MRKTTPNKISLRNAPAALHPAHLFSAERLKSFAWFSVKSFSFCFVVLMLGALIVFPSFAQDISIDFEDQTTLTERAVQLIGIVTILSLAPSILVMVTSFTRIVVVLSLLRTAIGLQTAPPNSVMISLALFLTAFIMAPTLQASYDQGVAPLVAGDILIEEAIPLTIEPLHEFMRAHVRDKDVQLFLDLTETPIPENPEELEITVLVPAFMISELRRAFEIGFLLFVPFIVIDMVIASVLMSMGMMMLPPIVISLPFKLIFFCVGRRLESRGRLPHPKLYRLTRSDLTKYPDLASAPHRCHTVACMLRGKS